MDVRTILGWGSAGVVAVAGFFGIDNAEHLVGFYKDKTISASSPEASFLVGDWCGLNGERQRFERRGKDVLMAACVPGEGRFCGPESVGSGAAFRKVSFGWSENRLTYRAKDEKADILINQISSDRFQAYLDTGNGFSEWRRCTTEDNAPRPVSLTPAPAPELRVEPFTPTAPLYIKVENARYRVSPFATDATPIAMTGQPGDPVTVTGRILQPDGYWYEVRLAGGTPAFIRADLVTEDAPAATPADGAAAPETLAAAAVSVAPPPPPPPKAIDPPKMRPGAEALPPVPRSLRRMAGTVAVDMCVGADGRVMKADISASSGKSKLDQAVLRWLQDARFLPAQQGGKPTAFCGYRAEYVFQGGG